MTRFVVLLLVGCGSVDGNTPLSIDAAADATGAQPDAATDAPSLPDGLVAWYKLDAVTSSVVEDTTGANPGACSGAACPTLSANGRVGGAYLFDGKDDIVRVPSSSSLKTSTAFTVTAWVNGNQIDNNGCFVNKVFGDANENSWQGCVGPDGMLYFFSFGAGVAHRQVASRVLDAGQWYHVALWWSDRTKRTYVNGVQVASDPDIPIVFDDQAMTIGCDLDSGSLVAPFNGLVDDVRVYNYGLSVPDLTALQ